MDKNHVGNTALHLAAMNGYIEIVVELLKEGAGLEQTNNNQKNPADLAKNDTVRNLLK
jgi:ankyrin repeat protein